MAPRSMHVPARVIVTGNNTVDHVYLTEQWRAGQKTIAARFDVFAGGQAANVATALAGLGLDVHYLGVFGGDGAGTLSRRSLEAAGCALDGCVTVPGVPQHHAVILVNSANGERTIVEHRDPRLSAAAPRVDPRWLAGTDALYLDAQQPETAIDAVRAARAAGRLVVADLERYDKSVVADLLAEVDELIAPREVLAAISGRSTDDGIVAGVLARGPRVVVATAGVAGCFGGAAGGPVTTQPARRVRVVDTTGAGDAFHAGYLAARLRGHDLAGCLAFATEVAAAKCAYFGPRLPADALARIRAGLVGGGPDNAALGGDTVLEDAEAEALS